MAIITLKSFLSNNYKGDEPSYGMTYHRKLHVYTWISTDSAFLDYSHQSHLTHQGKSKNYSDGTRCTNNALNCSEQNRTKLLSISVHYRCHKSVLAEYDGHIISDNFHFWMDKYCFQK